MNWFNRFLCWLTGHHIYSGLSWYNPLCEFCNQLAYDEDTRCTGWPKKEKQS
jgi:hypothetical protein